MAGAGLVALTGLLIGLTEWRRHREGVLRTNRPTRSEKVLYYVLLFGAMVGLPLLVPEWTSAWSSRAQTLVWLTWGVVVAIILLTFRRLRFGRPETTGRYPATSDREPDRPG